MNFTIDEETKTGWQANIAMAFYDAYCQFRKTSGKQAPSKKDILKIANDAAEYFLNLLTKDATKTE